MDFTKKISQLYTKLGIKTNRLQSPAVYVEPIIPLTFDEEEELLMGDGQSNPNEYKQVNSSTGLAVNYYKILESIGFIKNLHFENKVAVPLIKGGKPANLDVSYQRNDKTYYVESKFLEPYYSGNEHNRQSYFDTNRYDVPEKDKLEWLHLLGDAQNYKLYNFSQLCRHLLAIWRKHNKEKQKAIVFQSVTWKMSDLFISMIGKEKLEESFRKRRDLIENESKLCQERIDGFLSKICWNNMKFEVLHYNDMLEDISSSKYLEEFKKRYFL